MGQQTPAGREMIFDAALATARVTALVITILFASSLFSLVFTEMGGKRVITEFLTNIPGGKWGFLAVANIAIFLMGIPLEFIEISFIAMPIFVPAAQALGLDMVWLAVVFAINLQTAFILAAGGLFAVLPAKRSPQRSANGRYSPRRAAFHGVAAAGAADCHLLPRNRHLADWPGRTKRAVETKKKTARLGGLFSMSSVSYCAARRA